MCKEVEINVEQMKEKIRNSKLHVLTFATHEQGYFNTLKESCNSLNIKLNVLGWGKKWGGFIEKLVKVKEYLKVCKDNDIILFVDGFDSILLQPANVIIERYIINYDNLFVCTSESTYSSNYFFFKMIENMHLIFHNSIFKCNDNTEWDSTNIMDKYKDFTYFYKNLNLLNSGGWISTVYLAKKILQYIPSFIENDQVFLTNLYLDCNYLLKIQNDQKKYAQNEQKKFAQNEQKKFAQDELIEQFDNKEQLQYYNKIIIDNHNVIFHLFRNKSNVMLLRYEDCVHFFPFKPLLNTYYLNRQGKNEERKKKQLIGRSAEKDDQNGQNGHNSDGMLTSQNGKNSDNVLASQNEQILFPANSLEKKKSSIITRIKQILMKKKKKKVSYGDTSYYDDYCGDEENLKRIKLLKQSSKNKIEWMQRKTVLDDFYMDNSSNNSGNNGSNGEKNNNCNVRKIGQIEKTFNYSIVDTHTHTSPCILHIHCMRNIDSIIRTMGLNNMYSSKWYSNIWYLSYSLKGTMNFNYFSLLFSTVIASVSFSLIHMKYILTFLIHILDTNFDLYCMKDKRYISKAMFFLNDIEISCFLSFTLAVLFWVFYIFNKSIV
ncbi:procollagen lysine 5-dioxygenase, putative [Plasmodium malariae]|uniref:Procollagen lysine 5-dioxygenase, putative n=1 Tax=Plasmodium malariae TaxID=5858 RepID=A0A1D3JMZ1_PLAMA|nr:procollagen lysine 5-dioxygenase, putative [Plasmodium malariae]SBT87953.1 procollagen lysine 5-dioxygenase, putative [Plasmodium malariae]